MVSDAGDRASDRGSGGDECRRPSGGGDNNGDGDVHDDGRVAGHGQRRWRRHERPESGGQDGHLRLVRTQCRQKPVT